MLFSHRRITNAAVIMAVAFGPLAIPAVQARSAAQIAAQGENALKKLEAREPSSRLFARHAVGVLVFP